jgi:hypothetical protein
VTVLHLHILKLLSGVREDDNGGGDLLSEFVQLLISLLYLLIKCLILNLQLLEINQMQTICQLLFLLEYLLLVGESVREGDVLEAELIDLLVLLELGGLLRIDEIVLDLLACTRINCVLSHTTLQLLELRLDFLAFSLFLIEFSL